MKLASIETVIAIEPHGNADKLEIAKVLGWETIVKKGEFKAGDKAVFVVIDTILPKTEWSDFLNDKSQPDKVIRLKTIKLRGRYSQGLLLPITVLPEHMRDWQIGCDVGGELGIKKYEKEIPAQLAGDIKGSFPTYLVAKTDEDNGNSNPAIVKYIETFSPLLVTQKMDGSSCTIIIEDGKIVDVCSRNCSIKESETNSFWRVAKEINTYHFQNSRVIIQGELMGPGVQGNQLELTEPKLFAFTFSSSDGTLYSPYRIGNCDKQIIEQNGFDEVPLVGIFDDPQDWQALADKQVLPNGKPAEGIVVRPLVATRFGNGRPAGFKIINRNYKDT